MFSRASPMRSRLYVLWSPPRAVALHVGFCILPHLRCVSSDKGIRPGRRSGGAKNPMWNTWGTRLADTAIALRRCAGYIFCGCWQPGMHCGRPHMMLLSGRVGDPAGRRTPCGTHGAPDWPTPPSRFGDAQDMGK